MTLKDWERDIVDSTAKRPNGDELLHKAWLESRRRGMTALANYIELVRSQIGSES